MLTPFRFLITLPAHAAYHPTMLTLRRLDTIRGVSRSHNCRAWYPEIHQAPLTKRTQVYAVGEGVVPEVALEAVEDLRH
jgi:hypothetical protein